MHKVAVQAVCPLRTHTSSLAQHSMTQPATPTPRPIPKHTSAGAAAVFNLDWLHVLAANIRVKDSDTPSYIFETFDCNHSFTVARWYEQHWAGLCQDSVGLLQAGMSPEAWTLALGLINKVCPQCCCGLVHFCLCISAFVH